MSEGVEHYLVLLDALHSEDQRVVRLNTLACNFLWEVVLYLPQGRIIGLICDSASDAS